MSYTPDYANCRETQKITEPASSTYQASEAYGFDAFGNVSNVTVTGIGMVARTATIDWGTTGQFPTTLKDPVGNGLGASGYQTARVWDPNLGVLTSEVVQSANGAVNNTPATTWQYDAFARPIKQIFPDGTAKTWAYNDCAVAGCVNGNNKVTVVESTLKTDGSTLSTQTAYLDRVERVLVTSAPLVDGTYDRNEVQYDSLGNVQRQAAPCSWTSCTLYWTSFSHDALSRVTQVQRPFSASNSTLQTTTYSYQGRTQIVTDPLLNTKTLVSDVNGWLRHTQDAYGYAVILGYDAAGAKTSATDSLGNTLWSGAYSYGISPFLTNSSDADRGNWSYTVNALGELAQWVDANGNSFSAHYDALSRMTDRYEPDRYSHWTLGTSAAAHEVGKLHSACMVMSSATACGATPDFSESETYDSVGRLSARSMQIALPTRTTFSYSWQYNGTTGLLDTLTYPTSTSGYALQLQYGYQSGILQSITNISDSPSARLWTANSTNAAGQITKETFGSIVSNRSYDAVTGWVNSIQAGPLSLQDQDYLYDAVGNLIQRQDNNAGVTENFYYDALYRLDHSTLQPAGGALTTNLQMHYDAMGDITSRSDVHGGATWTYDATRKHAVTSTGSGSGYQYDRNGNVIRRGTATIFDYWSSNLLLDYSDVTTGQYLNFAYDQDGRRYYQHYNYPQAGGAVAYEDTFFIGDLQRTELYNPQNHSDVIDWRHYVYANGRPVAIVSRRSDGANTTRYLVLDHQGSIATITDGLNSWEWESFSPFGLQRAALDWSSSVDPWDSERDSAALREGYTFQGTFEVNENGTGSANLVHLNGRVLDAFTGRFLSADPLVSDPSNTQGYNRYSYVNNNPLTYIDPSGFNTCETGQQMEGNLPCPVPEVTVPGTRPPGPPPIPDWIGPGTGPGAPTVGVPLVVPNGGTGVPPGPSTPTTPIPCRPGVNCRTPRPPQKTQCTAPPISPAEQTASDNGDRAAFWNSRAARGDPMGPVAREIVTNTGIDGVIANGHLFNAIVDRDDRTGNYQSLSEIHAETNQIGVQIMQAHVDTVAQFGTPSPAQIAAYHFQVFNRHDLPNNTFGGSIVTGTEFEAKLTAGLWLSCH